jgi:hypothetical protein
MESAQHDKQSPAPAPRKRFRIVKLEERIAPGGGGNGTHNCGGGSDTIASQQCTIGCHGHTANNQCVTLGCY